jgi:hypothetical protein
MTTITEAAQQPSSFTATFTIRIDALRTTTVNGLADTVKEVAWTMVGVDSGQTFELPQVTDMPDPGSEEFIPFADLTEAIVVNWIETTETRLPSIKAHIQYVLDKQVTTAALNPTPAPWLPPAPPTPPAPTPPEV